MQQFIPYVPQLFVLFVWILVSYVVPVSYMVPHARHAQKMSRVSRRAG